MAELVSDGEVIARIKVDGSSMFRFVNVEPGDYQVVVNGTSAGVTAETGGVARVNLGSAGDRLRGPTLPAQPTRQAAL